MPDDHTNGIRNKSASPASSIGKDTILGPANANNHTNIVSNSLSESEAVKIRRYYSPTIRLNITLREPDDHSCSVFDYTKLLSQEKNNRKREREKFKQPTNEVDDPTALDDDAEEEIKRLAQHFEQKYGSAANAGSSKKKKKKKAPTFYNYTELAHGYDESDSFIDNSEAFDEALPDEMETYHGGYYVNCGQLKFKKIATATTPVTTFASADENSDTEEIPSVKKRISTLKSSDEGSDNKEDSSESSEQSESEGEETNANAVETESAHASIKRKSTFDDNATGALCKRIDVNSNKSAGEVATHSVNGDHDMETAKFVHENHAFGALASRVTAIAADERASSAKSSPAISQTTNKIKRKYKKRNSTDQMLLASQDNTTPTSANASSKSKKKMLTVKVLLEEKRIGDTNLNYASLFNDASNNCIVGGGNGGSLANIRFEDRNSISDVIESVVNAARNHSEDSRESNFSSSDTKSIDSRTSGDTEKENHTVDEIETAFDAAKKLVHDNGAKSLNFLAALPIELQEIIAQIKLAAPRNAEAGSRNVFNSQLNAKLISLETKSRALNPTCKHLIYEHCANFLPCSKESLMKRAKRLLFEEEEERVVEYLKKLKHSIDRVMPLLIIDANAKNSMKKKFTFNEETRDCLGNVITCHLSYLRKLKPKKDSFEQSLKKFIDARVQPLWPENWISTDELLKVIDSIGIPYTRPKLKRNHAATTPSNGASVAKKSRTPQPTATANDSNGVVRGNSSAVVSKTVTTATDAATTSTVSTTAAITTAASTLSITNVVTAKTTAASVITASAAASSAANETSWKSPYLELEQVFANVIARAVSSTSSSSPSAVPNKESSSPPKKSHSRQFPFASSISPPLQSSSGGADLFKIDSIIASGGKTKTEPQAHLLNHASQYNKHYSHKGVKRKSGDDGRDVRSRLSATKDENLKSIANMFAHCNGGVEYNSRDSMARVGSNAAGSKSNVTISSKTSSSAATTVPTSSTVVSSSSKEKRSKTSSFEEAVLDLSPNKPISIKNEPKSETSADAATSNESAAHANRAIIKHVSSIGEVKIIPSASKRQSPVNEHAAAAYRSSSSSNAARAESKEAAVSRATTIVSNANSNVKPPLNRKERILLGRSSSDGSYKSNSSSSAFVENRSDSWSKLKDRDKSTTSNVDEKRAAVIAETTTATDILSQIINDSLRETNSNSGGGNSSRFGAKSSNVMATFKNESDEPPSKVAGNNAKGGGESSKSSRDRVYRDKQHAEKRPRSAASPSHSVDVTASTGGRNSAASNQAEMEAADVIKELLSLNQIGGHSIPRRMYYKDQNRFSVDRNANNSVATSGASSNLESSLPIESTAAAQRPIYSDFQGAYFQHIMKRDCTDGNAPT